MESKRAGRTLRRRQLHPQALQVMNWALPWTWSLRLLENYHSRLRLGLRQPLVKALHTPRER